MEITEEQIKRINQVINTMPIAVLSQAQQIVSIINESINKVEKNDEN
tara:strand:- start:291 stop:431 length:141 start_codon:yes stop_codon:yes gene_type:complete